LLPLADGGVAGNHHMVAVYFVFALLSDSVWGRLAMVFTIPARKRALLADLAGSGFRFW
jgi:hypothetical protein